MPPHLECPIEIGGAEEIDLPALIPFNMYKRHEPGIGSLADDSKCWQNKKTQDVENLPVGLGPLSPSEEAATEAPDSKPIEIQKTVPFIRRFSVTSLL